jgi:hypothetical protein
MFAYLIPASGEAKEIPEIYKNQSLGYLMETQWNGGGITPGTQVEGGLLWVRRFQVKDPLFYFSGWREVNISLHITRLCFVGL